MSEGIVPPPETPIDARRYRIFALMRRRPAAMAGALMLLTFVVIAWAASLIAPSGVHEQVGRVYEPPSQRHLLGLDDGGIDVVSLLLHGGRVSLIVGFSAALVATLLGGTIGIITGYFGGVADTVLMRLTDYFMVIPDVPLMIVIAAVWGPSLSHIVLVIGLLLWTSTARLVRSEVKSIRERVYISRARSIGATDLRIIASHVLPQVAPLLVANTVLIVATAIFAETALAFLGLSDPGAVTWGSMIQHAFARSAISAGAWWAIVPPGLCVALVIMACFILGQGLEDALNPRLKVAHLSPRRFSIRSITPSSHQGRR